jgi:hypothetical protein
MVRRIAVLAWLSFTVICAHASTIDFETLPDSTPISDGTPITNQFPNVTFTNTTVISAGITLNESDFPPHSGNNVAFDDGGPISIAFDGPVNSFGGFFTYTEPLTLAAFDPSDVLVAVVTSAFSDNLACLEGPPCAADTGSSPNEFLEVSSDSGISRVIITADQAGSSFTLDDATITVAPEPHFTMLLFVIAILSLAVNRTRQHRVDR